MDTLILGRYTVVIARDHAGYFALMGSFGQDRTADLRAGTELVAVTSGGTLEEALQKAKEAAYRLNISNIFGLH